MLKIFFLFKLFTFSSKKKLKFLFFNFLKIYVSLYFYIISIFLPIAFNVFEPHFFQK
jgi:hypothetical protein